MSHFKGNVCHSCSWMQYYAQQGRKTKSWLWVLGQRVYCSPVVDSVCHYASQTKSPSQLDKINASRKCFFFVNPALILPLYSDKILSPWRHFRSFFSIHTQLLWICLWLIHTHSWRSTLSRDTLWRPRCPDTARCAPQLFDCSFRYWF